MGWVGANVLAKELSAACVIEVMNKLRITLESLWRRDVLDAMFLPEAIAGAEGINARLRRDARAGKYYDRVN